MERGLKREFKANVVLKLMLRLLAEHITKV